MKLKLVHWLGITAASGFVGHLYAKRHDRMEDEWREKYFLVLTYELLKKIAEETSSIEDLGEVVQKLLNNTDIPDANAEIQVMRRLQGKNHWLLNMEPERLGYLLIARMENLGLVTNEKESEGVRVCLLTEKGQAFLASL